MLAQPVVRLASLADAGAIAALSRDTIETGLPWTWRPERVANAIRDPNTNVVVVGPREALEGFGIMIYREDDAHLVLFAVHLAKRRQGIASTMLLWLEDVARAAGCRRIRLEARRDNVAGRNFYSEHGYHERAIDKDRYHQGVDGVRLEKWLQSGTPEPSPDA
ncbi:GNAT family N-acetyltransferase [Ramlibacter alkalitolerans]|jgi:ribosomal-protein-alanine N-acetyltransferase|uniref:GNAT family N-acetyltransferase n=1 Tax=Ramlibacter alkalitolerans TaxID=2039631 RepID=A0ABS1JWD4_9BURK|nr:GNAT family N-acetyltransferase [Ramlibacter alkalitolerans]MBL0428517.1 GNAT family N-acetyltransferase [Ramlibacter alkalitolerans]